MPLKSCARALCNSAGVAARSAAAIEHNNWNGFCRTGVCR